MSTSYLIMLVEPKQIPWRISLPEFTEALVRQWENVEVRMPFDPAYTSLEWERQVVEGRFGGLPAGSLRGDIYATQDCVSLSGYPEDVVEFGVWFRQYVPEEYPLFFCDTAWCTKALIYPGMTYSELEDASHLHPLGTMGDDDFSALMAYSAESNWGAVREVLCRNVDPLFYSREKEFREAAEEQLEERIRQVLKMAGVPDALLKENPSPG